jgi:hypothetical protein
MNPIPPFTPEVEAAIMERYDQTEPGLQRKICFAFACKFIAADRDRAALRELLVECRTEIGSYHYEGVADPNTDCDLIERIDAALKDTTLS